LEKDHKHAYRIASVSFMEHERGQMVGSK
jgi:hypothetical protein